MTVEELIQKLQNLPQECQQKKVLMTVDEEWSGVIDVKLPEYRVQRSGEVIRDVTDYFQGDDPIFVGVEKDSYIWLIGEVY